MRARAAILSTLLSIGLLAGLALPARACSSDHPTFEHAVGAATSIARVLVVDQWEPGEEDGSSTYRVLDTLQGPVAGTVHLEDPRETLCGDEFSAHIGEEAIVAFGVPFAGESLTVGWFMSTETAAVLWGLRPVIGSTPVPEAVTNLDDLADAIRALVPDTALTAPRPTWPSMLGWILLAVAIALGLSAARGSPAARLASAWARRPRATRGGRHR